jgi:GxxExxY protein
MIKNKTEVLFKELSYKLVGLAMEVHKKLGPGFLEKVYENSMLVLLRKNNIAAKPQEPINVFFEGEKVGEYFADILVEDKIILELKTVDALSDVHRAQALNYLKATNIRLAIILNFKNESLEYERIVL